MQPGHAGENTICQHQGCALIVPGGLRLRLPSFVFWRLEKLTFYIMMKGWAPQISLLRAFGLFWFLIFVRVQPWLHGHSRFKGTRATFISTVLIPEFSEQNASINFIPQLTVLMHFLLFSVQKLQVFLSEAVFLLTRPATRQNRASYQVYTQVSSIFSLYQRHGMLCQ